MSLHSLYRSMFGDRKPAELKFKQCFASGEGHEKCCYCGRSNFGRNEEIEFYEFGGTNVYRCRFGRCPSQAA